MNIIYVSFHDTNPIPWPTTIGQTWRDSTDAKVILYITTIDCDCLRSVLTPRW